MEARLFQGVARPSATAAFQMRSAVSTAAVPAVAAAATVTTAALSSAMASRTRRTLWTGALLCIARPGGATPGQALTSAHQRRQQSTANRTKRALNVPPHASFLGGSRGGVKGTSAVVGVVAGAASPTTLLYNPPASAPSVYQTPFKFLPRTDPRRRANLMELFANASGSNEAAATATTGSPADPGLPPVVALPKASPDQQRHHLSEADVAELRRLRASDPLEWSVLRLARHFRCSPIFVMLAVRSSAEHREGVRARVDAARSRWGPIRQAARRDRLKRREMLYNGEL